VVEVEDEGGELSGRQAIVAKRLAICSECPRLIKRVQICKECGCFKGGFIRLPSDKEDDIQYFKQRRGGFY